MSEEVILMIARSSEEYYTASMATINTIQSLSMCHTLYIYMYTIYVTNICNMQTVMHWYMGNM